MGDQPIREFVLTVGLKYSGLVGVKSSQFLEHAVVVVAVI